MSLAKPLLAAVAVLVPVLGFGTARATPAQTEPWGQTRAQQEVTRTTLRNARGMAVSFISYGGILTALQVPDGRGGTRNVLLSLPEVAAYEASPRRFGGLLGRYAGRIREGRFVLDGRELRLPVNANGAALHGDPDGYDKRVWRQRLFKDTQSVGAVLSLDSPDGDQGMPGNLHVRVTYRLYMRRNEFRIEYLARADAPTVVNLSNHAFFNLAGAGSHGLDSHDVQILADRYAATDARKLPTGELLPVAGTVLDFRQPVALGERLRSGDALVSTGFDHSLVFARHNGTLAPVARVCDTASGLCLAVRSTEPSVQFNTGNGFDGSQPGAEGVAYLQHDGFAFETQHLPDSPNQTGFPSTVLRPGQVYRSLTSFSFSNRPSAAAALH
jgi:aldose 1-epimerase